MLHAEAVGVYDAQLASAASIESRATTLQGTVGIAVTLALAAAGLLLDPSKIPSHWWQLASRSYWLSRSPASSRLAFGRFKRLRKPFHGPCPSFGDIFEHAGIDVGRGARGARNGSPAFGRTQCPHCSNQGLLSERRGVLVHDRASLPGATLAVVLLVYVATARHGVAQIRLRGHRHH